MLDDKVRDIKGSNLDLLVLETSALPLALMSHGIKRVAGISVVRRRPGLPTALQREESFPGPLNPGSVPGSRNQACVRPHQDGHSWRKMSVPTGAPFLGPSLSRRVRGPPLRHLPRLAVRARVELARAFTPRPLSKRVPSPIGLPYLLRLAFLSRACLAHEWIGHHQSRLGYVGSIMR